MLSEPREIANVLLAKLCVLHQRYVDSPRPSSRKPEKVRPPHYRKRMMRCSRRSNLIGPHFSLGCHPGGHSRARAQCAVNLESRRTTLGGGTFPQVILHPQPPKNVYFRIVDSAPLFAKIHHAGAPMNLRESRVGACCEWVSHVLALACRDGQTQSEREKRGYNSNNQRK